MSHEPFEWIGRVLLPDSAPAVDVQVVVAARGCIQLQDGWPIRTDDHFVARTDRDGRFHIQTDCRTDGPFILYAVDESGSAIVTSDRRADDGSIELTPWLTVQGAAATSEPCVKESGFILKASHIPPQGEPYVWLLSEVKGDDDGSFVFDRVPAKMNGDVHRLLADGSWSFCVPFADSTEDRPIRGDRLQIDGRTVLGKVELPVVKEPIIAGILQCIATGFQQPAGYDSLPETERWTIYKAWADSPDGQMAQHPNRYAMIKLDEQGRFCVADVPTGVPLRFHVSVYRNYFSLLEDFVNWLRRKPREVEISRHFTLPEGTEPYDMGTIS